MDMPGSVFISVVIPVFRAEPMVDELVNRVSAELLKISDKYEIILVEDGSPDNSWQKINENCKKDLRIKGIKLSRNFGQHNAITAGLDHLKNERGGVIVFCFYFQYSC